MIEFIGIWFNTSEEVKRDRCFAKDAAEASAKFHKKYFGREEPGQALSIVPVNGYGGSIQQGYQTDVFGGRR